MIWLPAGGAKSPPSAETVPRGEHYIRMEGKETYRFATRTLASTALAAIEQGRPRAVRHRPVHPAPGEHPHHRGRRQGPGPADGPDVRRPRPVRQHVGGVGADRARRGGRRGPGPGRRPDRHRRLRRRVHDAAPWPSNGPPTRPAARSADVDPAGGFPSGCRSTGTRSTRSRPRSPILNQPVCPRGASPLDDVVPGEPEPRRSTRRSRVIDLSGKCAARHRRLARHRAGHRAPARDPGRRRRRSATAATPTRRQRPTAAIEALGRRALAVPGGRQGPRGRRRRRQGRARRLRQGRHPGQQRRDHPRRPDHAHERRRLARRPRDEPVRGVLHDQGGDPADAQGAARPDHQHHRVSGQAGQTGQANYSSAKAGLIGLTKATARELARAASRSTPWRPASC